MIKKYGLVVVFFLGYVLSGFSQGSESFNNLNAAAGSYGNGSYVGDNGVTWSYGEGRLVTSTYNITGTSIGFATSGTRFASASSGGNGVGTLTYSVRSYFTGGSASDRSIEVYVNGALIDSYTLVAMNTVYTRTATANLGGNVSIEFRSVGTRQLVLDDISWTGFTACTAPPDPIGIISGTTPACVSSVLSFSGTAVAPITNYWQTSPSGTDTAFNANANYTATSTGTYYVRAFNSVLNCWSTGSVSYSVVIDPLPTINTQPVNQTVNEGDNVTFSVVATNATSYQWEEFDGSTWTNVGTSPNYSIPAVPLAQDGYQYRVTVTNACGSVVSDVVTLNVLTAACINEGFNAGISAPSGWNFTSIGATYTSAGNFGTSAPSLRMDATNDRIQTPTITNATELSFWLKGLSINATSALLIEGYNGSAWITVDNITNSLPNVGTVYTYNASSIPALPNNLNQFRFTYTKSQGNLAIDDVIVYCGAPVSGPEISVTSNNTPITDGSTSPSTGNNTDFGSTPLNTPIVKTFRIRNLGTSDLTINLPITLTDNSAPQEFTITQPTTSTIAPGSLVSFTVTFNSAVAGLYTNSIVIGNNDSDENPYNFDIIATAVPPPPPGTTYNAGELIFVAYDGQVNGSGAEDEYLIATLVDMTQGTKFSIVNSRYEAGAPANVRTNKWGGGGDNAAQQPYEAKITYNGSAIIPAGSILRFVTNGSSNWFGAVYKIVGTTSTLVTSSFSGTLAFAIGSPNISTSGSDQMFLMQGDFVFDGTNTANEANYFLNGTLLHGLTNRAAWVSLANACNGDSSGGNSRESRLPSALTCFNVESISPNAVSGYYENDKEHGLATIRQIILAVSDVNNNWTLGTDRYTLDPSANTATTTGKTFVIGSSNPAGRWVGNVNTNWFNCANWEGLKVPSATTDVTVNGTATNNAVVDFNAPFSDEYSDLAVCNNLTINGKKVVVAGSINNKLQVNGNLLIASSGVLDMDDSNATTLDGELFLHGNWINSVDANAFEEGNGTVFFVGTTPQLVNVTPPTPPNATEEFYNVVLENDFNTAVSNSLHMNGNLTIEIGKTLTVASNNYAHVDNNLTVDGTFNILDSGSLVQVKDTGVNTGNISMERNTFIRRRDYVYWSSPVEGFSSSSISPASPLVHIYRWDPTIANPNGGQGNWVVAAGETMNQGVGYIVRGPSSYDNDTAANYTALFNNGKPHNGIVSVPIARGSYTGADYAGGNGVLITRYDDNWNLVGNPYPSAIKSLDFLTQNTNIDGFVNIWTHGTLPSLGSPNTFYQDFVYNYTPADYITYNGTGTTSGPGGFNGDIGAGQSFMINMLDGPATTSQTVVFNNSMRNKNHDNSQFFRMSDPPISSNSAEKNRIWLDLISPESGVSRTLVGYIEGATDGRDRLFDAVTKVQDYQHFYTMLQDEPFIIQGKGLPFHSTDVIPLGIRLMDNGIFDIAIGAVDGLFGEEQEIYLRDNLLNVVHNLKDSPYSFQSDAGTFNTRFEIIFQDQSLSIIDNEIQSQDLMIVELPDGRVKFSVGNDITIQSVEVTDLLGRTIYKLRGTNSIETYDLNKLSQTVYFAKVSLSNGQTITKRAIKRK